MKKILALVLAAIFLTAMVVACADPDAGTSGAGTDAPGAGTDAPPAAGTDTPPAAGTDTPDPGADASDAIKVALVAHGPESIQFDGSFNEGSWNGIINFLRDKGLDPAEHANFFQAHAADNDARVDVMIDAISWGADILILPGFHFAASVHTAAELFPDTKFVVLDTRPDPGPEAANTVSILYAEEQSGFLAGYAVVMDGFRDLGFMGGVAVPAVVRFGHGFIEGAEFAAKELGLSAGDITINYHYIGGFAPSPDVADMAGFWYEGGTEVIFAAAGGAGFSVISAAEGAGTWMVGVDVDQSGASSVVITSAMKALAISVYDMLTEFVGGTFRGGSNLLYDASVNGVALPMNNSRFRDFTEAQYNEIYAQLANGSIVVSTTLPEQGGTTDPNDLLTITGVTVNFIS